MFIRPSASATWIAIIDFDRSVVAVAETRSHGLASNRIAIIAAHLIEAAAASSQHVHTV